MKQNIEIEIPDGYEIENIGHAQVYANHNPTQLVTVQLKKKQTKDLSFYVDEYLRSDCNTTNDMLCNWIDDEMVIEKLKDNLKQNKLQFVPWEVKIGLLKFICKDVQVPYVEFLVYLNPDVYYDQIKKVKEVLSDEFLQSIR